MTLLIVAIVVGVVFTGMIGFFWLLLTMIAKTARRDAEEAIAPLRDAVLQAFDRLEAAKARRDKLSGAGQAGVAAPTGELAEKLERAAKQIAEASTGWTALEEKLRECRALVDSETRFGRSKLDDARDLAKQKATLAPKPAVKAALDEAEKLLDEVEKGFLVQGGLVAPRAPAADESERKKDAERDRLRGA